MESKTGIVLGFSIFYAIIIVLLGFYGGTFGDSGSTETTESGIGFSWNLIEGISLLPLWINTVLFGSLIIVATWLIISSLPTLSGGA